MHHQREKYNQISVISLLVAILIGFFAIFKSFYFFILLSLYLLTASIITEALLLHISLRKADAIKQLARGIMLFLLITFLLIRFMKGS